jgi:hypothetical protein
MLSLSQSSAMAPGDPGLLFGERNEIGGLDDLVVVIHVEPGERRNLRLSQAFVRFCLA